VSIASAKLVSETGALRFPRSWLAPLARWTRPSGYMLGLGRPCFAPAIWKRLALTLAQPICSSDSRVGCWSGRAGVL
jgi:hypothetical protein